MSNKSLNPLPTISLTSHVLGVISGISLAFSIHPIFGNFPYLPIYIFFISSFHFLEYFITSKYQPSRVNSNSFVLDNPAYFGAHLVSLLECFIEWYFFPNLKTCSNFKYIHITGILLVFFMQFIRSLSMITAGQNFSHIIKNEKENDHVLITHGIYKFLRHPSYFAFFYWALGTQLLLLNPFTFIIFVFLLYDFFSSRIAYEEATLIRFFGDDYKNYREKVPIGIPFIHNSNRYPKKKKN